MAGVSATFGSNPAPASKLRPLLHGAALILLLAPFLWLGLHWWQIPAAPRSLRGSRWALLSMPAFSLATHVFLGEFGLINRVDSLRRGSLSRLKPTFQLYFLTLRVEALAFFAVLSFAMDRAAMTGRWMPAKGLTAVALCLMVLTVVVFTISAAREAYKSARRV